MMPTTIVPPEGFETKMKQVLSQPIKLRQKTSAVKKPRREALVAPREVHMRRIEWSQCQDYGGGNNCSQATGSKTGLKLCGLPQCLGLLTRLSKSQRV